MLGARRDQTSPERRDHRPRLRLRLRRRDHDLLAAYRLRAEEAFDERKQATARTLPNVINRR